VDDAFGEGVVLPDGRVYLPPMNGPYPVIFDPATASLTTVQAGTSGFRSTVLLPSGLVFQVPYNNGVVIVNPVTKTVTSAFSSQVSGNGFGGAVLLPDGRVFCIPYVGPRARIYDPATNAFSTPNFPMPSSGPYFRGGALLPDGRVFCAPASVTTARIYDPVTDTTTTPTGPAFYGNFHVTGATVIPDGRVVCSVRSGPMYILHPSSRGSVILPMGVLTSPYLN
jgi:hypothetical protein